MYPVKPSTLKRKQTIEPSLRLNDLGLVGSNTISLLASHVTCPPAWSCTALCFPDCTDDVLVVDDENGAVYTHQNRPVGRCEPGSCLWDACRHGKISAQHESDGEDDGGVDEQLQQ
jgi:hypothetical protein